MSEQVPSPETEPRAVINSLYRSLEVSEWSSPIYTKGIPFFGGTRIRHRAVSAQRRQWVDNVRISEEITERVVLGRVTSSSRMMYVSEESGYDVEGRRASVATYYTIDPNLDRSLDVRQFRPNQEGAKRFPEFGIEAKTPQEQWQRLAAIAQEALDQPK